MLLQKEATLRTPKTLLRATSCQVLPAASHALRHQGLYKLGAYYNETCKSRVNYNHYSTSFGVKRAMLSAYAASQNTSNALEGQSVRIFMRLCVMFAVLLPIAKLYRTRSTLRNGFASRSNWSIGGYSSSSNSSDNSNNGSSRSSKTAPAFVVRVTSAPLGATCRRAGLGAPLSCGSSTPPSS